MAGSAVSNVGMTTTGPNISSREMIILSVTSAKTVGSMKNHPGAASFNGVPPSTRRPPSLAPDRITPKQGSKVLDIGCGQGESSLVLALINGSHGQITAIDTAPPGYGGPYIVHQSQKHIQASTLEQRIWLLRTDTASLLSHHTSTEKFNAAVLYHSLWYFPDRARVAQVFQLLADTNIHYLCLAEYGFRASRPAQVPHMLAVQTQAWYPSLRKSAATRPREPNVRSALTPDELLDVALQMDGKRNVPATYNPNHSRGTGIGKCSSSPHSRVNNGNRRKAYSMTHP
ncbi:hypothetical protein CBS147482_5838 [Aspergillus niger]|nr:hypothetical protein CBS133816_10543 [Aspergillus niger]KAI3006312.1 hypothetical protein CBS147482_5838 [Aspergillus niger]